MLQIMLLLHIQIRPYFNKICVNIQYFFPCGIKISISQTMIPYDTDLNHRRWWHGIKVDSFMLLLA
jgi:hypothetical protein